MNDEAGNGAASTLEQRVDALENGHETLEARANQTDFSIDKVLGVVTDVRKDTDQTKRWMLQLMERFGVEPVK